MTGRTKGRVVISHLGEPCVFEVERCDLKFTRRGLDLDVYTRPNLNCPLSDLCAPNLHIESATVVAKNLDELTEEHLVVDVGWDTREVQKEDNIFRIYISQHQALNHNRVRIVRLPGDQIEITWHSEAQDFLDFRNPDCTLEMHCVIDCSPLRAG